MCPQSSLPWSSSSSGQFLIFFFFAEEQSKFFREFVAVVSLSKGPLAAPLMRPHQTLGNTHRIIRRAFSCCSRSLGLSPALYRLTMVSIFPRKLASRLLINIFPISRVHLCRFTLELCSEGQFRAQGRRISPLENKRHSDVADW